MPPSEAKFQAAGYKTRPSDTPGKPFLILIESLGSYISVTAAIESGLVLAPKTPETPDQFEDAASLKAKATFLQPNLFKAKFLEDSKNAILESR